MSKKNNNTLSLDGKINKLEDDLLSVNVTFYPSNSELEFIQSSLEKRIEGDDPDQFFLIETDGEIEAVDIYSFDHCFSCKHTALLKLIRENPDKKFLGCVYETEIPDANHPILQVVFTMFDEDSNSETEEDEVNLDDLFDEDDSFKEDEDDFDALDEEDDDLFDEEDDDDLDDIDTYSIEDVWVKGFVHLTEKQKDYVRNDIKVGDRVFLRHEFDNPVDSNALLVLHEGIKIGYVQAHKAPIILQMLQLDAIGFIQISSIDDSDPDNVFVNIDVYYKDEDGYEDLPYYPLEGRQISVAQPDLWTNQKDYLEDWHLNLNTDQLCYKFKELYDSAAIEEDALIGVCFDMVIKHYLDGTGITDDCIEKEALLLKNETSKKILRKQVESYMESMGFEFRK